VAGSPLLLLALLALATLLFLLDRFSPDLVALGLLAAMLLLGYVSTEEAFSGFGSPAIVILVSAFVFTAALTRSGVSRSIGRFLVTISAGRPRALRGAILVTAAAFSLVINNVAAAAVLLPGASEALRRRRISLSKVLLPLAMATQLGGMATLLTTSNIVVGEVLRQRGFTPLGLTDFFRVGGPLAVAGLLYVGLVASRLLPERSETEERLRTGVSARTLTQIYQLSRRMESVRIRTDSPLVGATLGKSGLAHSLGAVVIALVHPDGSQRRAPESSQLLAAGDILILDGVPPDRAVLDECGLDLIRVKRPTRYLSSPRVALREGVVAPRSRYAGRTLRDLNFRETHGGISVLSIWRAGSFLTSDLSDVELQFGDALLMQGPRESFRRLGGEGEIVLLGTEDAPEPRTRPRAWVPGAILLVSLAAAIALPRTMPVALFFGAVAMLLAGSVRPDDAYRAVDWRAVILVGAMLPLGIALSRSGAASVLADAAIRLFHAQDPLGLLAVFALLTVVLTQLVPGGAAAPLIVAPIAISTAVHLGVNPRTFAMAVALATSTSMLTPFSHPVNLLVMGPGGYRFADYGRVGLPLVLGLLAGIVFLVPRLIPF
jgi:di/tricarboxylate transporter